MNKRCKKIKSFIDEEKSSSKEYNKMGFKGPASDEMKHSKYFKKIYDKECK